MKKSLLPSFGIFLLLLFIMPSSFGQSWSWGKNKNVRGNGNIVSETRSVDNFSKMKVQEGLRVVYTQDDDKSVVVKADENLQDYIKTYVDDNRLVVEIADNVSLNSTKSIRVFVSSPHMKQIKVSSGASVITKGIIKEKNIELLASSGSDLKAKVEVEKIKIDCSSGADIMAQVNTDMIETESSSGSEIELKGEANSGSFSASSSGDIEAKEFTIQNCQAAASSGGSIEISVKEVLNATASSGGDIDYYGSPSKVSVKESSGGDITEVSLR